MTNVKRSKRSSGGRRKRSTVKRLSRWNKHVKSNFRRLRANHPGWSMKKIFQQLGKTYSGKTSGGGSVKRSKRSRVSKRSYRKRSRSGVKKKSAVVIKKPRESTHRVRDYTKFKYPASWQRSSLKNTTPNKPITVTVK